jgi:saxitoxin biosynthesis operon SxtJ-like protein
VTRTSQNASGGRRHGIFSAETLLPRRQDRSFTTQLRSFRQEREFGLLVGAVFCALGGWWLYRGRFAVAAPVVLIIGSLLLLSGTLFPSALRLPYRWWMALAEALSFAMTHVILALVFFGIVTPIGLLRKSLGGDPLRRRAASADSYWWPYSDRLRDPRHFEKMF